jgi:Phosphoglycerate dehydrogenase and related dehydrogenases
MVLGHMLALTRTIPWYHRDMLGGRWTRGDSATRHELRHYRLGIVGLGEVGRRVARLAAAFGMTIAAFDPYLGDTACAERHAVRSPSLETLVGTLDILTLHVPLTEETRGMIGEPEIASMKPGSFLINAARGEILDTEAALEALSRNHLHGLALDVFDPEPPDRSWPEDPRLILTPHIGGGTHEARASIGIRLWEKISAAYPPSS